MKPNNYYYRHIAIKRGYNWDEKFHSSYYFMRKIAESYGYTYTTRKPSNKFLRDFCTSEAEHTPETFEYNIYYLYKIAKKLYPSTESGKTENYYLRIICEHIGEPTPTQVLNDITVELTDGKQILSYADVSGGNEYATLTFTALDESDAPIPNLEMTLDVTGEQSSTITTDANGQYEITYNSQGAGDIVIGLSKEVSGTLLTKTYTVEDCVKYISSQSYNHQANHVDYSDLYDFATHSDCVITGKIKGSAGQSFGLIYTKSKSNYSNIFRAGVSGGGVKVVTVSTNGTDDTTSSTNASANVDIPVKLVCDGTNYEGYMDNTLVKTGSANVISELQYIRLMSWATTTNQTVTITDFKVKPL